MKDRRTATLFPFILLLSLLLCAPATSLSGAEGAKGGMQTEEKKNEESGSSIDRITRQGVTVEFSAGKGTPGGELIAGDFVDVTFRITDASTGEPLKGVYPGVWIDPAEGQAGSVSSEDRCKQRVGLYLMGLVGIRPMIDLNSFYVLVMNQDPSISVIDPVTGITGITNLYGLIVLKRAGADWAKTEDEKRLFVSMPVADMVAVVDTDTFKVTHNVQAGDNPLRVRLQPDEKYLWVGNDSRTGKKSGVTVIETDPLSRKAFIQTGEGHHEIAFSGDSRYAFVTNREGGTVTVIDARNLEKAKDIETGPTPISLAYSNLSKSLYVADGKEGVITVIDGRSHEIVTRIETKPGLGPMGFSQDGRWGFVVNTQEDAVFVFDPSVNALIHDIKVSNEPYQLAFSRSFAYVRSLGTERVSMIDLTELDKEETTPVVTFPAGQTPPKSAGQVSIADAIIEAPGEAAVMVVSPADNTVYYYMEGMNAPMGNFRNYGHRPRAVQVADRAMREKEPGVYSGTVRIPSAGMFDVAFLLESPSILHCFQMTAKPNPLFKYEGPPIKVEYFPEKKVAAAGETVSLRLLVTDALSGEPRTDLKDLSVLYYNSSGQYRTEVLARHAGEGYYESSLTLPERGAYYVYVGCPSLKVKYGDLVFLTVAASSRKDTKQGDQ